MRINRLQVRSFRNLTEVDIVPDSRLNIIFGVNGSGKTSLLEAIHLLAVGRSFLTPHARNYIQNGASGATVTVQVQQNGAVRRLGIQRDTAGGMSIRIDGREANSIADLAAQLPIVLLTPQSHELVSGGPRQRREFLDWGLFHVEHSFFEIWRRMRRALKQRNAELRQGGTGQAWDALFVDAALAVSERRTAYLERLGGHFVGWSKRLLKGMNFELELARGWPIDKDLIALLTETRDMDRRDGYTHYGPHRAELKVKVNGAAASERLSRGQEKLLVYALRLAQLDLLKAQQNASAVVLVDDIAAELDSQKRILVMDGLQHTGAQVFITVTEPTLISHTDVVPPKMFHVEHGQVREMVQCSGDSTELGNV